MSRPLVCDNPGCETLVRADELDVADLKNVSPHTLPVGWLLLSEVDSDGDDVVLGECCSRVCAAALLTIEVADADVS